MTFKQLLGYDLNELEAMSDEKLRELLAPYIAVVQPANVVKARKGNVIDVSGNIERAAKKNETIEQYVARMTQAMAAKMESL